MTGSFCTRTNTWVPIIMPLSTTIATWHPTLQGRRAAARRARLHRYIAAGWMEPLG